MNIKPITKQVEPPKDNSWGERLRFYCQCSSLDDPNLNFMARMGIGA